MAVAGYAELMKLICDCVAVLHFIETFVYLQCLSTFRRFSAMPAGCLVHQSEIFLEALRWSRCAALLLLKFYISIVIDE